MATITRRGFEIPKTYIDACKKSRDDLTIAPLPTHSNPRPFRFPVYIDLPDRLVVPMHWAKKELPTLFNLAKDTRHAGTPMSHVFSGELQKDLGQLEGVSSTIDTLHKNGGAVLSLAVGHGKTICGLYIACKLRTKTLILVHKKFLADQWAERIRAFVPTASTTFIQGDTCDLSGDFVVAMIQTLLTRKYPPEVFESCGLLIFDEAHHVAAKVFCQTMFSLNMPNTLGLTATPTRKDGLERLIYDFLGDMAYSKSLQSTTKHVTVQCIKYACTLYADPPPLNVRGDIDYTKMLSSIASNDPRTRFIVDTVTKEMDGKDVLILSHRRAHCENIVKLLLERGLDASLYVGGIKSVPNSKIIVSSYSYVSEGFDEPRLEVLVLATPASDVSQTVGRILRGNDPHKTPVIYDFIDAWSICFAQASKRRKQYLASGFIVNQR